MTTPAGDTSPSMPTRLRRDERGGVAIMFMFMVVGLFGFVALSIDTSMWYSHKRRLQTAADAASRAGAFSMLRVTYTEDEIVASARADAARYGIPEDAVTVNTDRITGTVETIISLPASLNFARMWLSAPPMLTARATSAAPQTAPPCLTILDPTGPATLDMSSAGARITAPTCRVQVNSNNDKAIDGSGGHIEAAQICVTGRKSGGSTSSVPIENCPALSDPLASWVPPDMPGTCDFNKKEIKNQTAMLFPGTYCNGLKVDKSTVTLNPGIYFVTNGVIQITSSMMKGDGVAFLIGGDTQIVIDTSTLDMTAIRDGRWPVSSSPRRAVRRTVSSTSSTRQTFATKAPSTCRSRRSATSGRVRRRTFRRSRPSWWES